MLVKLAPDLQDYARELALSGVFDVCEWWSSKAYRLSARNLTTAYALSSPLFARFIAEVRRLHENQKSNRRLHTETSEARERRLDKNAEWQANNKGRYAHKSKAYAKRYRDTVQADPARRVKRNADQAARLKANPLYADAKKRRAAEESRLRKAVKDQARARLGLHGQRGGRPYTEMEWELYRAEMRRIRAEHHLQHAALAIQARLDNDQGKHAS